MGSPICNKELHFWNDQLTIRSNPGKGTSINLELNLG